MLDRPSHRQSELHIRRVRLHIWGAPRVHSFTFASFSRNQTILYTQTFLIWRQNPSLLTSLSRCTAGAPLHIRDVRLHICLAPLVHSFTFVVHSFTFVMHSFTFVVHSFTFASLSKNMGCSVNIASLYPIIIWLRNRFSYGFTFRCTIGAQLHIRSSCRVHFGC